MNNPLAQLNDPSALGQQWQQALMGGYQFAREQKVRSALGAYAMDPNMDTVSEVMRHDPMLGMELRRDEQQRAAAAQREQAAQQNAQREQAMKIAQLLEGVKDEATYQQARQSAEYLGMDLSRVPPQYDQGWVEMNKRIVSSFLDDDDSLPQIAQEIEAAGFKRGTPEFETALRNALTGKYGVDYTDERGQLRRRSVFGLPGQQAGPQPGVVEDGYRFKGGDPADPSNWEQVAGGGGGNATGGFRP